ncbi:DUF2790 domain-containing protein [Pseudomonas vancouverensis]|uniref:DUF2790 domain-containing protein n=1 Tax=Pseudomonas vancouverensis TaxID=95300 RepID=A0A1H2NAG7_PSEVA|nr:DUF2790 domain-containing protein [Pseudomonas vancouverensis]KAB0494093.1 DUF2790 domain-containing protein [Pseudomonas vancouverensis]TDB61530.1 DUF2790 domain-containing protein [Pseudomonas vancouverensis]SDV02354.1 Protein of unknown function [Pseudomonas vancouverensis]
MKLFMLGFAALLATGSAFAANDANTSVIHDKDGFYVPVDVAKVVSMTDLTGQCGVVPAQFKYIDHQGRQHELDYQVEGTSCLGEN